MFYINYEECKLQYTTNYINHSNKFYINYEECKSLEIEEPTAIDNTFYINYEECKYILHLYIISESEQVLY
ncbi:Uncharacterised protein [Clostridium perfringens]|nr:Uncharacterised protein [Clostridium perfringens]